MKVLNYVLLGALLVTANVALANDKEVQDRDEKAKVQVAVGQEYGNTGGLLQTQADEFIPSAKKHNPHEILNTKFLSKRPYMPAKYE